MPTPPYRSPACTAISTDRGIAVPFAPNQGQAERRALVLRQLAEAKRKRRLRGLR